MRTKTLDIVQVQCSLVPESVSVTLIDIRAVTGPMVDGFSQPSTDSTNIYSLNVKRCYVSSVVNTLHCRPIQFSRGNVIILSFVSIKLASFFSN